MDLSIERCTNVKTNERVIMPDPMTAKDEAKIAVITDKTMEVGRKYLEKSCDKDGNPLRWGFPPEIQRGIEKLLKREKAGDIV